MLSRTQDSYENRFKAKSTSKYPQIGVSAQNPFRSISGQTARPGLLKPNSERIAASNTSTGVIWSARRTKTLCRVKNFQVRHRLCFRTGATHDAPDVRAFAFRKVELPEVLSRTQDSHENRFKAKSTSKYPQMGVSAQNPLGSISGRTARPGLAKPNSE